MTQHSVLHATFTIERVYSAPPARVFAAWSNPVAKAQWFAMPDSEHTLDFRVGGREVTRGGPVNGSLMTFDSQYQNIVANERIVYTSTLSTNGDVVTVSLTSVEFNSTDEGTRLVLTEHGAFLDEKEKPEWREQGTGDWLNALGRYVQQFSE